MNYLSCVVFVLCIVYACACSCPEPSDDETYCSNNTQFVVEVKVKSTATTDTGLNKLKYKIQLDETYKSTVSGSISKTHVYTATSDAQCGVTNLEVDKYYILSGTYFDCNNNKKCMNIALCNSIINKYDTSPDYTPPTCT